MRSQTPTNSDGRRRLSDAELTPEQKGIKGDIALYSLWRCSKISFPH